MVRNELTHASFFSGVGGLDLGLERAGWRTVSFSEIEPYACAVLTQRWPGVPNLGSIVDLAEGSRGRVDARVVPDGVESSGIIGRVEPWHGASLDTLGGQTDGSQPRVDQTEGGDAAWKSATLWSGGFP